MIVVGAAAVFFVVIFVLSVRTRRQVEAQDAALTRVLAENAAAMKRLDDSLKSGLRSLQEYRDLDASSEPGDGGSGLMAQTDGRKSQERPASAAEHGDQRLAGEITGSVARRVPDVEVDPLDPRFTPALADILKGKGLDWGAHLHHSAHHELERRAHYDALTKWRSSTDIPAEFKPYVFGPDKWFVVSAAGRHEATADKHELPSKVKRHPAEPGQPPVRPAEWQTHPWRTDLGELLEGWLELDGTAAHGESRGEQRSITPKTSSTC
jgi:hypothetical protein